MYNEKDLSLPTECNFAVGDQIDLRVPCCCCLPSLKTYTADKTYGYLAGLEPNPALSTTRRRC